MKKTIIWLDDIRSPHNPNYRPMIDALLTNDITEEVDEGDVIWVKSYTEFVKYITEYGLPDIISLDHDLAESHYDPRMYQGVHEYSKLYGTFIEKTGYDCAHWLVNYCLDNGLKLPEITQCHSQNPAGKKNILSLLSNFRRNLSHSSGFTKEESANFKRNRDETEEMLRNLPE